MDIELSQLHSCLDALEEQEASLLSWGDSDGFFSEEEVLSILGQILPEHDPENVKIELLEQAMLFEVPHQPGVRAYRTRMGEGVRLYRSLRQWFPWQTLEQSRTLVSDYRFVRRPRTYPKRELVPLTLLDQWREELKLGEVALQAMANLLDPIDSYRLSGFQERATTRICKAWQYHGVPTNNASAASGTIVCAGTGSGKTLSFYLPALSMLAADVCEQPGHRVRVLAIYPRKELLKDQFMESWLQCRKLDSLLLAKAGRKLRIGAFFGDTPYSLGYALKDLQEKKVNNLPFDLLRCITSNCSGTMVWSKSSMEAQKEELTCKVCGRKIGDDEVALTRQLQSNKPVDILFTTTEMLSQHLGNNAQNHLFGIGSNVLGPILVLLDEAHTYGGNTGAQTAFLLRRWMQRARCRPHFAGLSATLVDAESFFAQLIGTDQARVELVEARTDEIEDKGAEYLLALRGDPVSETALLSTTIQASMLTRRILDPLKGGKSKGTWGSKTFIFTDDLDVTNRLYHQLSDAEGWKTSYRGLQPNSHPLAHLRQADLDQHKINLGQNWRVVQDIGHSLSTEDRSRVARTSSQDMGVDARADSIVATASLEVGFNDPLVGAVIQHKAPRDVASYLQRKGRAGRPTQMRPWMLVVLSEFGRDRVAFQRYEDLISPEIKRQPLPLHNSHIQKMQAAMATLDWLSIKLGGSLSIWTVLKGPQKYKSACTQLGTLIADLLRPCDTQLHYFTYLDWALGKLGDRAIEHILWAPPRSVMLEFLPTLHRLVTTQWREQGKLWEALSRGRSPLPQFIPDTLFSTLNQPSLAIALQRGPNLEETKWESLNFYQGLREFAPGRISKRFAVTSDWLADWVIPTDLQPVPDSVMRIPFEVSEAFGQRMTIEGEVEAGDGKFLKILTPTELYTRHLATEMHLTEKSNSSLQWHVAFSDYNEGVMVHKPPKGGWEGCLLDTTFYTHGQMSPLEVTRYATGATASLRFVGGGASHIHFEWQQDGQPVGIGDRQWIDGVRFRLKISNDRFADLMCDPELLRAIRPVYFRHCVTQLEHFANDPFTANWVSECFLAALANEVGSETIAKGTDFTENIRNCLGALRNREGRQELLTIPLSLFQPDEQQNAEEQGLHERLRQLLTNQGLLQQIENCEDILWEDPNKLSGFDEWLRMVMANTLAAATQQMLCVLLPDVDERAILADALWKEDMLEIWITETESGGSGVINRLSQTYFEDPVHLLNILVRCLQPSQYEQIDYDLFSMLEMLEQDEQLQSALDDVRYAGDHQARRQATSRLHGKLQEAGFALSHSFNSVLFSRVIRPGSNQATDARLLDLLRKWKELERTSGLEWGLNIATHTLAKRSIPEADPTPRQVFNQFCRYQGLLWPRGYEIRQSELGFYSPFQRGPTLTERLLGATLFNDHTPQVRYGSETWLAELHDVIRRVGRVELIIERTKIEEISVVIARLQTESLEYLGLFLYPRIRGVRRLNGQILLRIEMAEMLQ
jgi:hypothetical protein